MIREVGALPRGRGRALVEELFYKRDPSAWDSARIEAGRRRTLDELAYFERALAGEFFLPALSAVDFTLYPYRAMLARFEKKPDLGSRPRAVNGSAAG